MSADDIEQCKRLMSRKADLETELEGYMSMLTSLGVGMDKPLVDSEGFPRSDIDVYQVREARHKVACLRNDAADILNQIEKSLHSIHAKARGEQP